jgi:hypothetical protein
LDNLKIAVIGHEEGNQTYRDMTPLENHTGPDYTVSGVENHTGTGSRHHYKKKDCADMDKDR